MARAASKPIRKNARPSAKPASDTNNDAKAAGDTPIDLYF